MEKKEKLGTVQYYLRENPLSTSDENAFMAAVKRKEVQRQDQIITQMTLKNTTISREEIELVLNLMKQVIKKNILAGFPVIMDLFKAQISVKGGFTDGDDEFDDRRHYVNVSMSANRDFKKELAQSAFIEKVKHVEESIQIFKIYDYATRSFSDELSAGSLVSLKGVGFMSDEGDPEVVLEREGTDESVTVANLHGVSDRELLFNLPEGLEAGDYRIKLFVRCGLLNKPAVYKKLVSIG